LNAIINQHHRAWTHYPATGCTIESHNQHLSVSSSAQTLGD